MDTVSSWMRATLLILCQIQDYCVSINPDGTPLPLPVRYRFHDDCMEFGKGCTFVDWQATDQNEVDLAKQTFKAMVESW